LQTAIPSMLMRGGTSKGLYFKASDLPEDMDTRDRVLLAAMGSPDERQIDGIGGAHPLTSKVAIVSLSNSDELDIDYLFLQVMVDKGIVSDAQNCGNILAGVGPYAIEAGMLPATGTTTDVRIHMLNTGAKAIARVQTPDGKVEYDGQARIDGVPGTSAAVPIDFLDIAGSSCGALLPTGQVKDSIKGIEVTCIDNGMPVVLLKASDFGLAGTESPEELETNLELKNRIEAIRLEAGKRMNLGDVSGKTVPKMSLISAAQHGGSLNTRTFIPHRVHEAIGVLGSVSVATACMLPGSVAQDFADELSNKLSTESVNQLSIEHPTGSFSVEVEVELGDKGEFSVKRAALLRTARLLMRGEVYVPERILEPVA
jgi:4-oxalomesaconate tautomerase